MYQQESERLSRAESLVRERYPRFGVNKRREVVRLLYEISRREDVLPEEIVPPGRPASFRKLKRFLLERRFPRCSAESAPFRAYLPRVELDAGSCLKSRPAFFSPRRILVEESASRSSLAAALKKAFPRAECARIESLKKFMSGHPGSGIRDYNKRSETVFVINEERDFYKRCPCTVSAVPCGYHIFNLSFGCLYECTYCFLQAYVNTPGIILPANMEGFLDRFSSYRDLPAVRRRQRGKRLRLGTGEFSDSLMLDGLTGYSLPLVEFFRGRDDVIFEFKTKSANIENLLRVDPGGSIVVAWSLNPQEIISQNELYTASLDERLAAAVRVSDGGYRLAFHFDPVFFFEGWERAYHGVIERLFDAVDPGRVAWISLGTLRFKPSLKKIIEARFPENEILDAEMVLGYDDKLRYPTLVRYRIYRFLLDELKRRSRALPVYLCMENRAMWKELQLDFPF